MAVILPLTAWCLLVAAVVQVETKISDTLHEMVVLVVVLVVVETTLPQQEAFEQFHHQLPLQHKETLAVFGQV
jgi:hypothetical protein